MRTLSHVCLLLALILTFTTASDSAQARPTPPKAADRVLARPADGFSLTIPAGWHESEMEGAAAAMTRRDNAEVGVFVFVRRQDDPTDVNETLAQVLSGMKKTGDPKLLLHRVGVVLDRPALLADYEDADNRYRTAIVPRDTGPRSDVYYTVTAGAPKSLFARLARELDLAMGGFRIATAEEPSARSSGSRASRIR